MQSLKLKSSRSQNLSQLITKPKKGQLCNARSTIQQLAVSVAILLVASLTCKAASSWAWNTGSAVTNTPASYTGYTWSGYLVGYDGSNNQIVRVGGEFSALAEAHSEGGTMTVTESPYVEAQGAWTWTGAPGGSPQVPVTLGGGVYGDIAVSGRALTVATNDVAFSDTEASLYLGQHAYPIDAYRDGHAYAQGVYITQNATNAPYWTNYYASYSGGVGFSDYDVSNSYLGGQGYTVTASYTTSWSDMYYISSGSSWASGWSKCGIYVYASAQFTPTGSSGTRDAIANALVTGHNSSGLVFAFP